MLSGLGTTDGQLRGGLPPQQFPSDFRMALPRGKLNPEPIVFRYRFDSERDRTQQGEP